jgi:hypothetical protein
VEEAYCIHKFDDSNVQRSFEYIVDVSHFNQYLYKWVLQLLLFETDFTCLTLFRTLTGVLYLH